MKMHGDDMQSSERYLQVLHYKKYYLQQTYRKLLFLYTCSKTNTDIQAIDSVGVPPLPIPNREVKPNSADGTAKICGRVGHRRFLQKDIQVDVLFFVYSATTSSSLW